MIPRFLPCILNIQCGGLLSSVTQMLNQKNYISEADKAPLLLVFCIQAAEFSELSDGFQDAALSPWSCCMPGNFSQKPAGVLLCLANIFFFFFFSTEFKRSGIKGPNLWNAMVFLEYVPHTCAINSQSFQTQAFTFRWLKSSFHSPTIARTKNENSHWNSSYLPYLAQLCQLKRSCFQPGHVHTSENYLVKRFFCGENMGTACGKIGRFMRNKSRKSGKT